MRLDKKDLRMIKETERILKGQSCPFCSSEKVAQIRWGLPMFSQGMEQLLAQGKVVLGGCVLDEADDQDMQCLDCEKTFEFHKPKQSR